MMIPGLSILIIQLYVFFVLLCSVGSTVIKRLNCRRNSYPATSMPPVTHNLTSIMLLHLHNTWTIRTKVQRIIFRRVHWHYTDNTQNRRNTNTHAHTNRKIEETVCLKGNVSNYFPKKTKKNSVFICLYSYVYISGYRIIKNYTI